MLQLTEENAMNENEFVTIRIPVGKLARSYAEIQAVFGKDIDGRHWMPGNYELYKHAIAVSKRQVEQGFGGRCHSLAWEVARNASRMTATAIMTAVNEIAGPEMGEYMRRIANEIATD
jgi:hypothetical protein